MRGTQFAQLTAFAAVAEHASFTRAAAQLGISTPSLSQAIRSLEEELGVRLLNRTTRSVALTEAGAELLTHLEPVLAGVDRAIDAVNAFRSRPAGTVRLAVHPIAAAAIVAPLVARFAAANPDIRLDIRVDAERKDIVGERFDAGIHLGDDIDQDMIAVPIGGRVRLVTAASPAYLARSSKLDEPADLAEHDCIRHTWSDGDAGLRWRFEKNGREVEIDARGTLTVDDVDLALRAARDGIGLVRLPDIMVAPHLADGRLVAVLTDWCPQTTDFVLYYSSRRLIPTTLRILLDFLRTEARQTPLPRIAAVPSIRPDDPAAAPGRTSAGSPHRARIAAAPA